MGFGVSFLTSSCVWFVCLDCWIHIWWCNLALLRHGLSQSVVEFFGWEAEFWYLMCVSKCWPEGILCEKELTVRLDPVRGWWDKEAYAFTQGNRIAFFCFVFLFGFFGRNIIYQFWSVILGCRKQCHSLKWGTYWKKWSSGGKEENEKLYWLYNIRYLCVKWVVKVMGWFD